MAKTGAGRQSSKKTGRESAPSDLSASRIRIDKWLWQARFFKSRTLASEVVESGHVRVNGTPVARASKEVGTGDTLTFAQGRNIRLIRILGTGVRRGPASEAQSLFIDLDAPLTEPPELE